ncbi:MAG: CaiB/BaiF CoA-transferase family protein [Candidatus Binatia bacterium]
MLEGVKIIDLSRVLPGNLCTSLLSALGAEVIKVEQPGSDRTGPPFLQRGKRSITLNLKKPEAKQVFYKLAEKSDIVVEGFRPRVANRLNIDYGTLCKVNPRIIYCSISSFGQHGPYTTYSAHDINFLGLSGILSLGCIPGELPLPPATQIADVAGGAMPAVIAILAAYIDRERYGKGQYLDISILDWTLLLGARYLLQTSLPSRKRFTHIRPNTSMGGVAPCYGVYETSDKRYITLAALGEEEWRRLCEGLGIEKYVGSQFVKSKIRRIQTVLKKKFKEQSRDYWVSLLRDCFDLAVGPVYEPKEVLKDRQVLFHGTIGSDGKSGELLYRIPFWFSTKRGTKSTIPRPGQHTNRILQELGYSHEKILRLRSHQAV